jgi:hypothetical protein
MGKINVYLDAELEKQVKEAGVPISSICQAALREAVDAECDHPELVRNGSGYKCSRCRKSIDIRIPTRRKK